MSNVTEAVVFQFRCTRCYGALLATADRVGETLVCPGCGTGNRVPEATESRIAAAQFLPATAVGPATVAWQADPGTTTAEDAYQAAFRQFRDESGLLAAPLARLLAQLVDGFCQFVALAVGFLLAAVLLRIYAIPLPIEVYQVHVPHVVHYNSVRLVEQLHGEAIVLLVVALLPAAILTIGQWLWMGKEGRTIGKRLLGIRIARKADNLPPGFFRGVVLRCWLNNVVGWFIPFYSGVDVLFIFRQDARCLHDFLAGTIVLEGNIPHREV